MRILTVLAHPSRTSFNYAIADQVRHTLRDLGHECDLHDLYELGFDPVLMAGEARRGAVLEELVGAEVAALGEADGIVIIHPNWWGMPPAVLVGWVDRVVRVDSAYRFVDGDSGEGTPVGLLTAQSVVVLNTSDTYPEREEAVFGDPLQRIWRDCIFGLCGITDVRRRTFGVIVTSTEEQRVEWLDETDRLIRATFPSADGPSPVLIRGRSRRRSVAALRVDVDLDRGSPC